MTEANGIKIDYRRPVATTLPPLDLKSELAELNDQVLLQSTVALVKKEKEIFSQVLMHLNEVDRRRLYADLKYKSLFDFAVRHLGYAEDAAYRRIAAARLLREIPEIQNEIEQGKINLTHVSMAQRFFNQEKVQAGTNLSSESKREIFQKLRGRSKREAERNLLSSSSFERMEIPDQISAGPNGRIELHFSANAEVEDKIIQLRGYFAHKFPNMTLGQIFEILCDSKLDELRKKSGEWKPAKLEGVESVTSEESRLGSPRKFAPDRNRCFTKPSQAKIREEIFARSQNKCENCDSTFALEVDHIRPKALGGKSDAQNLRVLCRSCNQRSAIKAFGIKRMEPYL